MQGIRITLIVLLTLLGVFILVSASLPGPYRVERSTIIDAPASVVFEAVNDYGQMKHWSPWTDYDKKMKTSIDGRAGMAGYKYSWTSANKKIGEGSITRLVTDHNHCIVNALRLDHYGMNSIEEWRLEEMPGGVKLTWINTGNISFAFRIPVYLVSMEKMVAPDFERGLFRIKNYCENQQSPGIIHQVVQ